MNELVTVWPDRLLSCLLISLVTKSRHQQSEIPVSQLALSFVLIIDDFGACPWPGQASVVTIGAFDGLHVGHRAIINQVLAQARTAEDVAKAVLITFDRHPASLIRPDSAPRLLTEHQRKLELLAETGLDATAIIHFDEIQAAETPEAFVERVLVRCLRARTVVVGEDFHFGQGRRGNVALLRELGQVHGFEVQPISLIASGPGVASSTAIRAAVAVGDIAVANELLARPFELAGIVQRGDERGRTIGSPTANVEVPSEFSIPAEGVYAAWYVRDMGHGKTMTLPAAVNIGRRPTFYENAPHALIEAHVIDQVGLDLYGEMARLKFVERLRGEQKFSGVDELKNQLQRDIEQARRLLTP
jgi:riboflavin kinase/FMN adenylyltransferase